MNMLYIYYNTIMGIADNISVAPFVVALSERLLKLLFLEFPNTVIYIIWRIIFYV